METEEIIRNLLVNIGENPNRPELLKTPARVAKFWQHVSQGYKVDVLEMLKESLVYEDYNQMIIVKDLDFFSLCEHHLVPFFGKAHVAYIPNGKIIGFSKIPRVVTAFSQRLQIQERLTQQIADTLNEALEPKGVGVIIEARHLCMQMRGVEKQNSNITTSVMLGELHDEPQARAEFLKLISR
ncbi:MAG TPA: GTP cyclohydrolase I FolE [Candidatus Marinimicrobia bacterium]|nr:GTP cyclohydrolase I FolE [Candidatus Neomarinimicrobiota bacterium]HQE94760.1 GTP cyclohydrolase I FolE [Candidatus Neomarinimicrobiota bacterium]HQH56994.1 GTP cyclohydrolase I FolE [Candidatus Neomarinimicrobiota bacterium]HQK11244.1 GTP cyclohydrolase I FolE [Candidatus Neomarinimicrobiota bacterium]